MPYRLGVDIGGTFTDVTIIDENSGQLRIDKVASTPKNPSLGFIQAVQRILKKNAVAAADVDYVVHGTTVATNSIIEGKVAHTGFITTEGFRDMLEIARQTRPSLYDLQFEKPKPLVPRYLCFGVAERLDARGNVVTPLDEAAVVAVAKLLREAQVEAVAVCLLHAYVNAQHEQRIGEILRRELPGVMVSLSSEVAPEFREYFRASTTVINACIRPVMASYLASIEERLRIEGLASELLVMQSNGGVLTFEVAQERPVYMVESGPAAGVVAATYLGETLGHKNIISLDIGGTTAKVGLVQNGIPRVTKDYEVGATARPGVGSGRGAGYPIRTPVIDLVEIGAGGGSIAWVDSGGVLRVGPRSAGADPGPACYGWGGTEPTLTDANLLLGRLNPEYFLGGEIKLSVDRARAAIQEKCADPLGLDVVQAAYGIIAIANAAMNNALRLISVQRGYDPREFVFVAFGGAGPVHCNQLANEIDMPTTIVPPSPGIFSALGLLVTDLKHEFAQTFIHKLAGLDPQAVEVVSGQLEQRGRDFLQREGVVPAAMSFLRQVDLRYVGQSYELTVSLPEGTLAVDDLERLTVRFHAEHQRMYGFNAPREPVEIVNVRVSAKGDIAKPKLRELALNGTSLAAARKGVRPVYFAETEAYVDCPIYERTHLPPASVIAGPAIVEEMDSTTVIHPHYQAVVDRFGNLILTKPGTSDTAESRQGVDGR